MCIERFREGSSTRVLLSLGGEMLVGDLDGRLLAGILCPHHVPIVVTAKVKDHVQQDSWLSKVGNLANNFMSDPRHNRYEIVLSSTPLLNTSNPTSISETNGEQVIISATGHISFASSILASGRTMDLRLLAWLCIPDADLPQGDREPHPQP